MPILELSVLGPPLVKLDGSEIRLRRRKVLALLVYLAITARRHSRDSLAELLYPDHDREQAYSDLRQTLSALRAAIGETWIFADRTEVALANRKHLRVDLEELRRLVGAGSEAQLAKAAALVRGPFLAGFYLKDCPGFEEWQEAESEGIRREEAALLENLAQARERQGEHQQAIGYCRTLLSLDAVNEETHRLLMRLYAVSGQRPAALAQYKRCRAALQKELGEDPGPETEELHRQIAAGEVKAPAGRRALTLRTREPSPVLVGRAPELKALRQAIEESRHGHGKLVVLEGDAGIGKTRLLEEAAVLAERSGSLVVWGRCYDDKGLPPYWPWRQVLDELVRQSDPSDLSRWVGDGATVLSELVTALPDMPGPRASPAEPGNPESRRFRLHESVARLLRAVGDSRLLVMMLDDIHWADAGSLDLLEFVSRDLAGSKLAILASCRNVEADRRHPLVHCFGELARQRGFRRTAMKALSQDEVRNLVSAVCGRSASRVPLDALWDMTRGNPLFVVEILRASGAGEASSSLPARGSAGITIPPTLRAAIGRRVSGLSPECIDVVTSAAAMGALLTIDLLCLTTGLPQPDLLRRVDEAVAAGVLIEGESRPGLLQFSHPLIQESLAAELTGARRAEVHARITAALEASWGQESEKHAIEIAGHMELGRPIVPAARLARYCLLAGEQAIENYDREAALRFFRLGIDAKGPAADDDEMAWLRFGVARAVVSLPLFGLGIEREGLRLPGAWAELVAAYEHFRKAGDTTSALTIASYPLVFVEARTGRWRALCDDALGLAPAGSAAEGTLLINKAVAAYLSQSVSSEEGSDLLDRVATSARQLGDRQLELRALAAWANYAIEVQAADRAAPRILRALELISEVDDPLAEYNVRFRAYHLFLIRGDLRSADVHAAAMAALASRMRATRHLHLALLVRVELEWTRGAWGAMVEASDQALALASDTVQWRQHLGLRAWLDLERGRSRAGEQRLARYASELQRIGIGRNHDTAVAISTLGFVARATEDEKILRMARAAADSWIEPGQEEGAHDSYASPYHALIGLSLVVALQRDRDAAARLMRGVARARGNWMPGIALTREEARGLLSSVTGDHDAAVAHLRATVERYRGGGMKTLEAWACCEYAEALLARDGEGDHQLAAEALREGGELSRTLGMRPLQRRIRTLMQKAAGRRATAAPPGPRSLPRARSRRASLAGRVSPR